MNCPACHDLLFDFVYGLLDESEEKLVREHIATCAACAAALTAAKTDQLKLGRAALAISEVASFQMPSERDVSETIPAVAATIVDQPAAAPRRRGLRTLVLGGLTGAIACCLVLAGLFVFNHQERVTQQETRVANLIRERDAVDARLAALNSNFGDQQKDLPAIVNKDALQVHVAGPGQALPGVSANCQVAIRDLDGNAKSGTIEVEFVNEKNQSLAKNAIPIAGNTEVPFPDELARNGTVRMKVVAKANNQVVGRVEETIASRPAEQAAHLATNKILYRAGDKAQVRALVLDRVTLLPAVAGSKVAVSLLNANAQPIGAAVELTTLAGMGAGEIKLPANLPEGVYTLEARGPQMAPVTRTIEVLPTTAPPIEVLTLNNRYRAGEPIAQSVQILNRDGTPAANTPVAGNASVVDQKAEGMQQGYGARNNNAGIANNTFQNVQNRAPVNFQGQTDAAGKFLIQLPGIADAQTGRQQLQANISYGADRKENATVVRELQVQPSQVVVEFFPEGGRLIAGTPNRVFYRVRAPEGDATASARFVLEAGTKRIYDSQTETSVGSFSLTPDPKTFYTLKILSPRQGDLRNPFASLGLQTEGLLVRGESVQKGGRPLKLVLENRGSDRVVQMVATCRGQVVAHARIPVKASASNQEPLAFELPMNVDGVVRVTALEARDGQLVPLAERLFFRTPSRNLDISVHANADTLQPQQPVKLQVNGRDEAKAPLAFWALASVVDDRFRDGPELSPAAQFLLLGDTPADIDLSEMPIVGLDGSQREIELALGVFGWRRVGPAPAAAPVAGPVAMAKARELKAINGDRADATTFFYRVEPSVFEIRQKLEKQWHLAQLALVKAASDQKGELVQQQSEVARRLASARTDLDQLNAQPRAQMLVAIGILALTLLACGAFGMLYGLSRLLRNRSAGMTFGISCGCLAGCLALLVFRPADLPENRAPGAMAAIKPVDDFRPAPRMAIPAEKVEVLHQANAKVALDRAGEGENADRDKLAAAEGVARPNAEAAADPRFARGPGAPAEQVARLDQSRQALVRNLKEAEMRRGAVDSNKGSRNVALEANKQADRGGFGAGLGGGALAGSSGGVASAPSVAPGAAPNMSGGDGKAFKIAAPKADSAKGTTPLPAPTIAPSPLQPPAAITSDQPRRDDNAVNELAKKLVESQEKANLRVDLGQLKREFAVRGSQELSDPATLLWNPALFVPAAGLSMPIDLPAGPARYRVLILGHTENGRLGMYDGVLNAK